VVIRSRVENDVDVHIGFYSVTDAEVPGGSFGGSLVLQRKLELRSFPSDRHDRIVVFGIPKVCEVILGADFGRWYPPSEQAHSQQSQVKLIDIQPMQETVPGGFNSFPTGERLSEVGQQRSSLACNRIYRSTIVNKHLLLFDQAMIHQPLKPMIKRPLGTLQIFQPQKLEQLHTRDESGPQDLL
jgi:hypothetical protein